MLILYNLDCFTGDAEDFCIQINCCDSTYWVLVKNRTSHGSRQTAHKCDTSLETASKMLPRTE